MDEKSRITGDCYVRICGSRGLKCPRPPDQHGVVEGISDAGLQAFPVAFALDRG
jgi:hypothetical protein